MAKRTATSNLNRDNWNEDETPEEMGVFQKASPNELKMRAIKRAKRRGVGSEDEGISIFKNFKAFGASNAESVTPTFSFLSEGSEKPKLTNPNPFPSFSLNKLSDSSKTSADEPLDAVKTSTAKDTTPSLTLNSASDSKSSKEALNPVSNKDENESVPKSLTFNFNVGSNKLMDNSSSATLPAFNFNTTKNFDSLPKQQPAGESIFKFGNDFKESEPSKTTTTPLFQFGIQATTKSNCEHPSSSLSSKSDNLKETQANNLKETNQSSKVNGMESNTDSASSKSTIFLAYLKALNLGVLSWVKQHLDKNQYINLTPIFNDYNKHLQEIKTKYSPNLEKGAKETAFASEKTKGNTEETGSCDKLHQTSVQPELLPKTTSSTPPMSLFRFGSSNSKWNKKEAFVFGGQSVSSPSNVGSTGTKTCDTNKTVEVKPFTFGISNSSPNSNASSQKTPSNESTNKTSTPLFSFGIKDKQTPSFAFGSKENKSTFSFGSSDGSSKISGFSFGVPKDKSTGFTFEPSSNSSSGFSFKVDSSNLKSPSSNNTEKKENEEEEASDEVPKVEVNEVKEEDAIYEKKVKLFYKKEDKYVDKGIGTLFLKPAGEKTQLLIRALTNLGNILLNIILNESIPTQRVGKNNVLLVCVPNPPIDPKSSAPVSLLIRVKTEADADEMLEKINEHKK